MTSPWTTEGPPEERAPSPQICGCCAPLVFLDTRTLESWDAQVASVHRCTGLPASFTLDCKRLSSLQLG